MSALASDACGLSNADQYVHDQLSTCNPVHCSVREDEIEAATEGGAPECTGRQGDLRPGLTKPAFAKRRKVCGTSREAPTGPTLTFSRLGDGQKSGEDPNFEGGGEFAEKVGSCACYTCKLVSAYWYAMGPSRPDPCLCSASEILVSLPDSRRAQSQPGINTEIQD
jgi:hypothetical protein